LRLLTSAGYSAYPRTPNFALLREIADEVGATLMVDMAHFAGLVAGGVLTGDLNPVPHAEVVTSTTHKSLRGPRGGFALCTDEYAPFQAFPYDDVTPWRGRQPSRACVQRQSRSAAGHPRPGALKTIVRMKDLYSRGRCSDSCSSCQLW
jgi:hypothetical protein